MGNPTKELRRMLDELGVKWETGEDSHGNEETWWRSPVFDGDVCATLGEELGSVQLDIPASITPEQAIAATVGKGVDRYDGSGRRGTVAILQGGRKPDEVLFVHDEGGVTHYLPEGAPTCTMKPHGYIDEQYGIYECSNCGESWQFPYDGPRENGWKYCPHCRAEIKEDK